MGRVRTTWLRGPRVNRPNELDLLDAVSLHTALLRAQRRNTGNAWDYATVLINAQQDVSVYEIPDKRFGRPLAVITVDDANPNHIQRRIPFFCPQNLTFDWGWPMDIGSWIVNYDGSFHSAERAAFYWQSGVPFLEFQPIPKLACDYLIEFTVGDSVDIMSLQDDLNLGEVGNKLIELRAAQMLLPNAEWEDSKEQNTARRGEITLALEPSIKLCADQFLADALIGNEQTHGRQWTPLDLV